MTYGAQSDKTANHTNCKAARPKFTRIGDVAGFYTNLADGPGMHTLPRGKTMVEDLLEAIVEGAVLRVRSKAMTMTVTVAVAVAVTLAGLFPIM